MAYKRDYMHMETEVDLNITGPTFSGASVFQYEGWYLGCQGAYAADSGRLVSNNFAMGYEGENFTVHGAVSSLSEVLASAYQRVNDRTEVALQTNYNMQSNNVLLALGGKYTLDDGAVFRAKVSNGGQVGLGYSQNLRDGVKLTLSALIEGKTLNQGGHKLGVALDFDA